MKERIFAGGGFQFPLGRKTFCMGVLNVTPDSFSDGGRFTDPQQAALHAQQMQQDGADVIDVGAESTRPGHVPVSPDEEIERLRPVLRTLCETLTVPISVDTRHAETAAWALEQGARIVNDVSGVPTREMADAVRAHDAGWICTHGGDADAVGTGDPILRVRRFFDYAADFALSHGIKTRQLCFDPGIGFGKSRADDFTVLRRLSALQTDEALLVGASRKRLIADASGEADIQKRLPGTIACHTAAIAGGADFIRVHDVAEAVQAMRVADAIWRVPHNAQAGKILIRDLKIFAYHGVNSEEKQCGQNFFLDVDLWTDFADATQADSIDNTVSYAQAAKTLQKVLTLRRYDLIETAAQAAADVLLQTYPTVQRVRLRLKKPDAPMKAACDYAAVEIERKRNG